jgi:bacillithiol biosynthesis cysteine-adding enzyme BshC
MPTECISYKDTNYFSKLICDYLDEASQLRDFYHRFPRIENFEAQISEKQQSYTSLNRQVLVDVLKAQYKNVNTSALTKSNMQLLLKENTFTITTGHQLNLFTGPLYFLYKIVSTINLTAQLKKAYPNYHFVPVYWMATEDHDFDEINYFNFKGKKLRWNRPSTGAVGRLSTEGLDAVFEVFSAELPVGINAEELKKLFKRAYLEQQNLSDATRFLANELFGAYGLIILDADDAALKKIFAPFVSKELMEQTSENQIIETNKRLEDLGYGTQVNPRDINLFYLTDELRERITLVNDKYHIVNTKISFTKDEILGELNNHPECFSPNVVLRPLYQEVILPNLCYIGGGGELAYWFQLKSNFDVNKVPFPMLLLRNSALIKSEKISEKLEKLHISNKDLFLGKESLINKKVRQISNIDIDFSPQKQHLQEQFKALYELAEQTDPSFTGAVKAQEVKQLKGLNHLEKRLLKAQKRKLKDHVERMTEHYNELFPNSNLQERATNFSEFYMEHGEDLVLQLFNSLEPLDLNFSVIEL